MITSRRTFLKTTALSGASLLIGIDGTRLLHGAQTAAGQFKPNVWIRIDPDESVILTIWRSEMGQGVRTSLAMLLAEELEADWSRIKLMQASPGPDAVYYATRLRGASNEKARRTLNFRPRRLEWL